ncbi:MAG: hypothetical protein V2J26_07580 [Pacificimonas sp.]|jgi:hypothetical protein|nr:hypothetical protein [Pacificimonas sp.]
MHPLVQDGDDPDVAIGKAFPVHEMALVAEEVPFRPELGRHGPRHHAASFNPLERSEKAGDVGFFLRLAPPVAGVAGDLIEAD